MQGTLGQTDGQWEMGTIMQTKSKTAATVAGILAAAAYTPHNAVAQNASSADSPADAAGLQEITVTAQRREENLQEVPIAVTALSTEELVANRVRSIEDLASMAPGILITKTVGGASAPVIVMRGAQGSGTAPGQGRQVGYYLDGAPIGSGLGQSFDIQGVLQSVEVLRGPQGTLFGRNSSAGAIVLNTMNPSGEASFHQELSAGNYDQFYASTRVQTPTFGPFSALLSYTRDQRDGDIRNLGAGTVWDRTAVNGTRPVSPKTLGDKKQDSVFAALKYAPNDDFSMVAKFDWSDVSLTLEGTGLAAFTSTNPTFIARYQAALAAGRIRVAGAHRPDATNNDFTVPTSRKNYGGNITTTWAVSEDLTLKNILAYRRAELDTSQTQDGMGGLLAAPNTPFVGIAGLQRASSKGWSVEQQLFYNAQSWRLSAGAMYLSFDGEQGGYFGFPSTPFFATYPNYTLVPNPQSTSFNEYGERSSSAFAQIDYSATDKLDFQVGARITKDRKPATAYIRTTVFKGEFRSTEPTYLVGASYKFSDDVNAYLKYSTGYLAGGAIGELSYNPETAKSWELGVKSEFLDNRVRMNVALFHAVYDQLQISSLGARVGRPEYGTIVVNADDLKSKGVEVDFSAAPVDNFTIGANLAYTDNKLGAATSPLLITPGQTYTLPLRAQWIGALRTRYESAPVFREGRVTAQLDGSWTSKYLQIARTPIVAGQEVVKYTPAGWVVNGRVALQGIEVASGRLEVALWAKNLFDDDRTVFTFNTADFAQATYQPARTYGVEMVFDF